MVNTHNIYIDKTNVALIIIFNVSCCEKKKDEIVTVCYRCLNNITCIFIHFFIHMYFQKIQTTLLKIS